MRVAKNDHTTEHSTAAPRTRGALPSKRRSFATAEDTERVGRRLSGKPGADDRAESCQAHCNAHLGQKRQRSPRLCGQLTPKAKLQRISIRVCDEGRKHLN